jgi:hypothetical protein
VTTAKEFLPGQYRLFPKLHHLFSMTKNYTDHSTLILHNSYEGESNENRKTEIKIRNIAPLSYKLADMLPML